MPLSPRDFSPFGKLPIPQVETILVMLSEAKYLSEMNFFKTTSRVWIALHLCLFIKKTMRIYYVYLLSSLSRRLYVGITSDLQSRVWQHKNKVKEGFTSRYRINRLVYYEEYEYVYNAISREKAIKGWKRERKVELIESLNARWDDLSAGWYS